MVKFTVKGDPHPQPRPRFRVIHAKKTKRDFVDTYYDTSGPWAAWREQVGFEANANQPLERMTGPVKVHMKFYFARPKAHRGTGRNEGELRPSAPEHHLQTPDVDNLAKLVMDVLTYTDYWKDDCQVTKLCVEKQWADLSHSPGMSITIEESP